jgi:L-seryl-tRNA(Ser) seleniumtransferase
MGTGDNVRRRVPSVDKILQTPVLAAALKTHPRWAIVESVRGVLEEVRSGRRAIPDEEAREAWMLDLAREASHRVVGATRSKLRRVINATGVVLHTNLGRAPLARAALDHVDQIAERYSNLELDLSTGERGSRYSHVESLVCELTGGQAAVVVNNNAAAVILCLSALTSGREVIISRGELVEIGGSFRIPEIMRMSGAHLVEVGTTNRTHLRDFADAINERTAMLLKVHTSNFRVIGFTSTVGVPEMVTVAKERSLVVMHDLGAGCFVDLRTFGLPHEPTVKEAIEEGADLVTFSGDKLLGGPQLGVIVGRADLIAKLKKHQLLRALRVDKLTLAAFEATLRIYRDEKNPIDHIPGLRLLGMPEEVIERRARAMARRLADRLGDRAAIQVVPGQSQVGAGSAPEHGVATKLVAVRPASIQVEKIEAALRAQDPPIMVRVYSGDLLIDLRTVFEDEEPTVDEGVVSAFASAA